jgi:hypothetical protein
VAGGVLVAAAMVATFLTFGGPGGGRVESASAAVRNAARATAESAGSSGTVTVEITYGGEVWAGKTVSWYGGDLAAVDNSRPPSSESEMRVVDGMLYGLDPFDGGWIELGPSDSIDPDSGTTPNELLAVTQADVTGDTLEAITEGMSGLATEQLGDGSTVYRGTVRAGSVAPETGFKEGQHIRVFPFGYVAHDEAADASAQLDAAVTVGADGLIQELMVTWGSGESTWVYTVTYRDLGTTAPIEAPENARPFSRRTPAAPPTGGHSGNDG